MASLLAVDLGGTKSRVGFYRLKDGDTPIFQALYKNRNFSGIEEVISLFCSEHEVRADYACLAIAGVVDGDSAVLTNLDWQVNKENLRDIFSFTRVFLLNDLTALSMSVPSLKKEELFTIKGGERLKSETIAVIAPGTGLGQGYLVPYEGGYIVKGSEGGHAGFAPANHEELEILRWMINAGDELSAEQVCAGPGIGRLYRFYEKQGVVQPAAWVKEQVADADDITPAVVQGATAEDSCPLCRKVIETYLASLGRESANLALKLYARGGVYVGGGVLLHLAGKVSLQPFLDGFLRKNKVSELVAAIPVYGIKKEDALLLGAFQYTQEKLKAL